MCKIWDKPLLEVERKKLIEKIPITEDEYYIAYGEFAFTTPEIRKWLKRNEKPRVPPSRTWGGIKDDTIFFTFKDAEVRYHGHVHDEAPCGFFINVYTNNDELRREVYQRVLGPINKMLEVQSHPTDDERDVRTYWWVWEIELTSENVNKVLNKVLPKIEKLICSKDI